MARLEVLGPDPIADPELRRMAEASPDWLELDPGQVARLPGE